MIHKWEVRIEEVRLGVKFDDERELAEVGGRRARVEELDRLVELLFPGSRGERRTVQKSYVRTALASTWARLRKGIEKAEAQGALFAKVSKLGREVMG